VSGSSTSQEALLEGVRALAEGDEGAMRGGVDPATMLEAIAALERALRAAADGDATALVAAPEADAPPRYRSLVEEYFRGLSEQPAQP